MRPLPLQVHPRRQPALASLICFSLVVFPPGSSLVYAATERGLYVRTRDLRWKTLVPTGEVWGVYSGAGGRFLLTANGDGSVHVSHDGGRRWFSRRLTPMGVYAVTAMPGRPSQCLASAGNGISRSHDGGHSWRRNLVLAGRGPDAFAWASHSRVFAATVAGGPRPSAAVFQSFDGGSNWRPWGAGLPRAGVMSLLVKGGRLFAGSMGHAVWRSPLSRISWRQVRQGMPARDDHGAGLAVVPDRRDLFVGTQGYGVFDSTNNGTTWKPFSAGLPSEQGLTIVLNLAYSDRDHALFAATPNGIYELRISRGARATAS